MGQMHYYHLTISVKALQKTYLE